MKTAYLLLKLQKSLKRYESKVKPNPDCLNEDNTSLPCVLSRYNLLNFREALELSPDEFSGDVDALKLQDLEDRIDRYFEIYAPDDEEFKEFTKFISVYLTFIAKKPLHPPGIKFSDGTTVYHEGDIYYCTAKKLHVDEDHSLCLCCVAQSKSN